MVVEPANFEKLLFAVFAFKDLLVTLSNLVDLELPRVMLLKFPGSRAVEGPFVRTGFMVIIVLVLVVLKRFRKILNFFRAEPIILHNVVEEPRFLVVLG